MANILGIDYYRVVSETGEGEWSQVYVKTAFDQEELARFGGVFGVVKLAGSGDLISKGMDLIDRVEKWCSEENHKGDVAGLLGLLKARAATGVFVWVTVDGDGERRIKVGAMPGNGVGIIRNGKRIWLFENGDGRILMGELAQKDKIFFGSKEAVDVIDAEMVSVQDDMEALTEKVSTTMMTLSEGARAALILTVKPLPQEAASPDTVDNDRPKKAKEENKDEKYREEVVGRLEKRQVEELAGERVVGATGLAAKLAAAKMSWNDLTLKWKHAGRLTTDEHKEKKHRLFLLIGGAFLVILTVSVIFGLVKTRRDRAEAEFASVFEPLEKKRTEAETLFELNPVGARDLLRAVREETAAKKGQFSGTSFEGRISDLERLVEESWVKVSGEQKVTLDLFFNLGVIRSQMKGDRMAYDGKNLLVLDRAAGVVAKVSYPDKKQEVVLGKGEGQNWLDVAGVSPNGVLLLSSGLSAVLAGQKGDLAFDAAVTEPVAVDMFGSAAYVLDKGSSEIWRFGLSGGTIGERRRWLLSGIEADLSAGADLAIDTDIWVGLSGGKILRFRRGQPERFNLSDVPEDFKIDRLAISGDSNAVAVLDEGRGRVVLFNKETGAYMKQILAPELAAATDLVWIGEKELMILIGDKIYQTSI
ncbi:MAG: hypothetical protein WAV56_00355 [Microgenomates group bacterium]